MKRFGILFALVLAAVSLALTGIGEKYHEHYRKKITQFRNEQVRLLDHIRSADLGSEDGTIELQTEINQVRLSMKAIDFWIRYSDPLAQKKINGPLPVEWESEVFEKFERPYRKEGAGLLLAYEYLSQKNILKDSLISLVSSSLCATDSFLIEKKIMEINDPDQFFFCNRLFILNLAAIYTTGFECPDSSRVIPELKHMLASVAEIYECYSATYPQKNIEELKTLMKNCIDFVGKQPDDFSSFNHFAFLRDHVNPLFISNQRHINKHSARSRSLIDYSLNKKETGIFNKELFWAQNIKGVFLRIKDSSILKEIEGLGKQLFYDPLLSADNLRSCASCHKPDQSYTDTSLRSALSFEKNGSLRRNTPSLLNAPFNHLLMYDGAHTTLLEQVKAVISNPLEMGSSEEEVLRKVLSCPDYKKSFRKLLKITPEYTEVSFDHLASCLVYYYSRLSYSYSDFDLAMEEKQTINPQVIRGFNLFMSKASCATCHFVPQFSGVKPPYTNSEFEVLGVPSDTGFSMISKDSGRYYINPAAETCNAFRTGTLRNISGTSPYMHNGVYSTLEQVLEFYDQGGAAGRGINIENQTLPGEALHLSDGEKSDLIAFLKSLDEDIPVESTPVSLPRSKHGNYNKRPVGGAY